MKKLNKHPRLYKKMANTLKKLITNKIKFVRLKMINGQNKNSLKLWSHCNDFDRLDVHLPGHQVRI